MGARTTVGAARCSPVLVGFHSRAGTPGGLLSHPWAGAVVHEITAHGRPLGEVGLDAALCGEFRVVGEDARDALSTVWRCISEVMREPASWLR